MHILLVSTKLYAI